MIPVFRRNITIQIAQHEFSIDFFAPWGPMYKSIATKYTSTSKGTYFHIISSPQSYVYMLLTSVYMLLQ